MEDRDKIHLKNVSVNIVKPLDLALPEIHNILRVFREK